MSLVDLRTIAPDLISYFAPGAIFIFTYYYLMLKKTEYNYFVVSSVILSYCIKSAVDMVNHVLLIFVHIPFISIYFVYALVGFLLALLLYRVKSSIAVRTFFRKRFNIEISSNVWLNVMDFEQGSVVVAYLRDGKTVTGMVSSVDDKWMVLVAYAFLNSLTREDLNTAEDEARNGSSICIPVGEIKCFEVYYPDGECSRVKRYLYCEEPLKKQPENC